MRRIMLLTAAFCAAILLGCRALSPETAKDADDVRVSIDEADRAFLYSAVDAQRLLELAHPAKEGQEAPPVYAYERATRELKELTQAELAELRLAGDALIAVSVEAHGADINLWNWHEGNIGRLSLRLDSLSARPVEPWERPGQAFDVVFTAKEGSLFPFCADKDYEVFKARLATDAEGGGTTLLELRQLTHNSWDDVQPTFSPDGHWVVFVTRRLGPQNVALMDANGDFVRLLTDDAQRSSYFPVVLPGNEECLYVSELGGVSEFFICGLDGRGRRRASGQELKNMLFSWDDGTRHTYLLTDIFAREQSLRLLLELPHELDLMDLVLLAEWNSPLLKQYWEKIRAARAEKEHNQLARGARVGATASHMVDTGVFVDETEESPFDRPVQGFTRLLLTLSFPLFQGSLKKAIEQRDTWQEVVYSQTYLKGYNELVYKVAAEHATYGEQMAKAAVLRRVLDMQRKRKFIWQVRVEAGKELPERLIEAEGYINEAQADLTTALGKAEAARNRLCAALGLKEMESLEVEPPSMDWEELPQQIPALEEFQGLAQVNHPELARLKFLQLRAAAIRDMGSPETRTRPSLDLTYGHGTEHFFSEVIDDFLSVSLGHTLPLAQLGVNRAFRDQWTHEILAYRQQREQARLDLNADLRDTYAALRRIEEQFGAARKWRDLKAERVRLSRIYGAHPLPAGAAERDVTDLIEAQIDHLKQQLALTEVRGEFCRRFAEYFYRAGLGRRLIDVLAQKPGAYRTRRRSVWLWRSLEVVLDPLKREKLLRLCEENGITRLYCFVSRVENEPYLLKHNWEFGYLLDLCRQRGIEVYALVGNPHWVEKSHREEIGALLTSIVEFNARAQEGSGGFAGLKLDVEPHSLPQWKRPAGRGRLVSDYLEMLDYVKAVLGHQAAELKIAADVPLTYAEVPLPDQEGATLFEVLCGRVDELTVMAYVDTPEAVVQKSLPLLQVAQEHGVPIEIGIETTPGRPGGAFAAGRSMEEVVVALDRVYERLAGFEVFTGFALHDYSSLVQLIERSHGH